MLQGRFGNTTGRPYIEGRLLLPRLNKSVDISFIIDTGADVTVLMPLDGLRMGLDYGKLKGDAESIGVGGVTHDFVEPAVLVFSDPARRLHGYKIELRIAPPSRDILDVPSILGRDVLNRWRLIYDPSKGRISCKVITADLAVDV